MLRKGASAIKDFLISMFCFKGTPIFVITGMPDWANLGKDEIINKCSQSL
jgi:hypothetical protein